MIKREIRVFRSTDTDARFKVKLYDKENGKEITLFSNDIDLAPFVADKFILSNDIKLLS